MLGVGGVVLVMSFDTDPTNLMFLLAHNYIMFAFVHSIAQYLQCKWAQIHSHFNEHPAYLLDRIVAVYQKDREFDRLYW